MKTQKLPKGWTLARNSKTKKYAVRNPFGLLWKWIGDKNYEGGTKQQAIAYAIRSKIGLAKLLKDSAEEEKLWKVVK